MISRDHFKNKRIAVVGLGHNGEMVEDIKFLIKSGAFVSVYDLKSESRLKNHLVFLRSIGLANYVCGSIPEDDLLDMDLIVLSHEYGKDSNFLKSVYNSEKSIDIEYPESLFLKNSPPVTIVGIMGEYGKSSLISMLNPLLELACKQSSEQNLYLIDTDSNAGTISHLKKIRSGDMVLMKISSVIMQEMYKMRISPHVAVFTSLPSQNSYNDSPFEILTYQTYNNFLIASDEIIDMTHSLKSQPRAKMLRTKISSISSLSDLGQKFHRHERDLMALAFQTAKLFRLEDDVISDILSRWRSLKGRIEMVKRVKGVEYYNDTASISPISTEMAIRNLSIKRNIVLIFGGVRGDGIYANLYQTLPQYVHTVILIPGSGTIHERKTLDKIENLVIKSAPDLDEAVRLASEIANKGDIVLFSPGFEAGGVDSNRKERGERFVRAVRNL